MVVGDYRKTKELLNFWKHLRKDNIKAFFNVEIKTESLLSSP